MEFESVIGLEVHAQLTTQSKIFCSCSTRFGSAPNSQTCPVCIGFPGALPVLNEKVVELAVAAALALNCEVSPRSVFARKNYFYPDLPKGYQISQYETPLANHGYLELDGTRFRILRLHVEEDAGKLVHDTAAATLVNLNRTGVPLVEIVTHPDFRSPDQALRFLAELRRIFIFCGISDGNMEEGSLRCDANISLRSPGAVELGVKTEVKNVNSFRFLKAALEFEIARQARALRHGQDVIQETRLFDEASGETRSMRTKEEAHDYRYFPDPDLLELEVSPDLLREIEERLPELPAQKEERLQDQYGLDQESASMLCQQPHWADYFEETVATGVGSRLAFNWILGDLSRLLNLHGSPIQESRVSPLDLGSLLEMVESGTLSGSAAKQVLEETWKGGRTPVDIVEQEGLQQISDRDQLEAVLEKVLERCTDQVEDYKRGKTQVLGFLVGQVMRETGGKANPRLVQQLLKERLEG